MIKTETSDEALAEKLGIDRSTVSRIRRGMRRPSITLAERISALTGFAVRLDDFSELPELREAPALPAQAGEAA